MAKISKRFAAVRRINDTIISAYDRQVMRYGASWSELCRSHPELEPEEIAGLAMSRVGILYS